MPYKNNKKRTPAVLVMIILIILSIAVVLVIYAIQSGFIKLPSDGEPVSTTPSEETSSEPPAPPEIGVTDMSGSGLYDKASNLKAMLDKKPFNVSIYYFDLQTGDEIEFNSLKKYQTGSVIKAPYCKWLLTTGADLNETLTLSQADILEGSGDLQNSPIGTEKTVAELIELAVVDSDNTAYKMLVNKFGMDGYASYSKGLGVSASQSKENVFGTMSAAGAGVLFADIYNYGANSPDQSATLLNAMKSSSAYNKLISDVIDYPVAHKYGYNNGNGGFHDAAIVYSDSPYILTIFTTLNPDKGDTVEYIQNISMEVDKIHSAVH